MQVFLKKNGGGLKWAQRMKFLSNIAYGMRYLHNRTPVVMHRDLKLENCLITEFLVLKLTDFGESKEKQTANEGALMTMVGTPFFIAPEVVNGDIYDEACDVFSFAILLCCLGVDDGNAKKVFSEPLRSGKMLTKVQEARLKGMHISNKHVSGWRADLGSFKWPDKYMELVAKCWDGDSKKRPTFSEICVILESWEVEERVSGGGGSPEAGGGRRRMSVAGAPPVVGGGGRVGRMSVAPGPLGQVKRRSLTLR